MTRPRDYSHYETSSECVYEPWPKLRCDRNTRPKAAHEQCYRCRGITAEQALAEAKASDAERLKRADSLPEFYVRMIGTPPESAIGSWMESLNQQMMAAAGLPRDVLYGKGTSSTAMDVATGHRDRHVDALQYAFAGRRSGKTAAMDAHVTKQRAQGTDVAVIYGHDRGMPIYDFPCECGETWRGTDRDRGRRCPHVACPGCGVKTVYTNNDCMPHHYIGSQPCAWNGRQRAVVEQEQRRIAPKPPTLREWHLGQACVVAPGLNRGGDAVRICRPPIDMGGPGALRDRNGCVWVTWGSEGLNRAPMRDEWLIPVPTLREWLGDRVSELGDWATVLREQPAPAAEVREWSWRKYGEAWTLAYQMSTMSGGLSRTAVLDAAHGESDPWDPSADALQMALFTRHPSVKPEPRKAPYPWSPEDQHETIARDA